MTIEVKLPIVGVTPDDEIETIVDIMQHAPELGFVFKAVVIDAIKQNKTRGSLWAVYRDGVPKGVAMIGSRRPYDHSYRTGDVTVVPDARRQRLGTCLYTATAMQGILEGRREVEETVIVGLSPWMILGSPDATYEWSGPELTETLKMDQVSGPGFLRSLNYKHYGTLPARTSGFRDIALMCHDPSEIDDYLSRLPDDQVIVELMPTEYDQTIFDRNMINYDKHRPDLKTKFEMLRTWLLEEAEGLVRVVS